jgi:hypothetical protein
VLGVRKGNRPVVPTLFSDGFGDLIDGRRRTQNRPRRRVVFRGASLAAAYDTGSWYNVFMTRCFAVPILLGALFFAEQVSVHAECVTIHLGADGQPITVPAKPPDPETVTVTGAFCGKAFAKGSYAPILLANDELDLVDESGIVAKAYPDANADFKFATLPLGKFRVTLPGFVKTAEVVEITSLEQSACVRPLFVTLQVDGECAPWSHITAIPPSGK